MYNPNQSASSRRSGEEFLRRMTRGEWEGCPSCGRADAQAMPVFDPAPNCCQNNTNRDCQSSGSASMPALAMVYSPIQEWTCLMESCEMALAHGTLFQELWKPFKAGDSKRSARR